MATISKKADNVKRIAKNTIIRILLDMEWTTVQTVSGWGAAFLILLTLASTYFCNRHTAKMERNLFDTIDTSSGNASATRTLRSASNKGWMLGPITYTLIVFSFLCAVLNQAASYYVGIKQDIIIANQGKKIAKQGEIITGQGEKIVQIEKKEAGRFLTVTAQKKLYSQLISMNIPSKKVVIMVSQCSDCNQFADSISDPLKKAGWDVKIDPFMSFDRNTYPHGIKFIAKVDTPELQAIGASLATDGFNNLSAGAGEPNESADLEIEIFPNPTDK